MWGVEGVSHSCSLILLFLFLIFILTLPVVTPGIFTEGKGPQRTQGWKQRKERERCGEGSAQRRRFWGWIIGVGREDAEEEEGEIGYAHGENGTGP
jgi:hypothetical protein